MSQKSMIQRLTFIGLALAVLGSGLWGCDDASQPETPAPKNPTAPSPEPPSLSDQEPPAPPEDGQSVASRVEEASTVARVKIALLETSGLDNFTFEPHVEGDQLTLQGNVATRAQREKAAEVAEEVEGVDEVNNQLLVAGRKVTPEKEEPSEQIAEAEPPSQDPAPDQEEETSADKKETAKQETAEQEADEEKAQESSAEFYTVKSGDSLWNIARKHNTSVSKLKQLNNMQSTSLQPGDELRVR